MRAVFERLLVPGLVVQAVIVGGGYATGRELSEFFLAQGPLTGLLGLGVTALLFSAVSMLGFELARRQRAFDYRSFCAIFLGRFAFAFELGYFATLLLVLSVVSAAASELLRSMFGWPEPLGAAAFVAIVAALALLNSDWIERTIALWSFAFYATYLSMCAAVLWRFGGALGAALVMEPPKPGTALFQGVSYAGYNIAVLPVLIFVARRFERRSEALIAGALTGPLMLLPAAALLLAMSAFYPRVVHAPLPISVVLDALDHPALALAVRGVLLGAMVKTGIGLLHGLNERVARHYLDRGAVMPGPLRPSIAVAATTLAATLATRFGLIDLVARGYRFSSAYFLLVFVLPLLTIGVWRLRHPSEPAAAGPAHAGRSNPDRRHR